jgi:hypothetical protein
MMTLPSGPALETLTSRPSKSVKAKDDTHEKRKNPLMTKPPLLSTRQTRRGKMFGSLEKPSWKHAGRSIVSPNEAPQGLVGRGLPSFNSPADTGGKPSPADVPEQGTGCRNGHFGSAYNNKRKKIGMNSNELVIADKLCQI